MTKRVHAFLGIAMAAAVAVPAVFAFPDGAPWEVTDHGRGGCSECHFDVPPQDASAAISIVGLPASVAPGVVYPLTIRLEDKNISNAGFMASAKDGTDAASMLEAGRFDAQDERVATDGARARSTEKGSGPASPGVAEWSVTWRAPESLEGPVVFDVWANAGNGDRSPFGDAIHHRVFEVAAGAGGKPDVAAHGGSSSVTSGTSSDPGGPSSAPAGSSSDPTGSGGGSGAASRRGAPH
ncbi:MAG TPA: choice-of-anchor V domain-containing protein [Gammaproteobacteria bacterium]